jgi:hypothetical protein
LRACSAILKRAAVMALAFGLDIKALSFLVRAGPAGTGPGCLY